MYSDFAKDVEFQPERLLATLVQLCGQRVKPKEKTGLRLYEPIELRGGGLALIWQDGETAFDMSSDQNSGVQAGVRVCDCTTGVKDCLPFEKFLLSHGWEPTPFVTDKFHRHQTFVPPVSACRACPNYLSCMLAGR